MCTVVVTDGEVGSPVVGSPSVSILLNQLSLDRYGMKVRRGGLCIVNSSLAATEVFSPVAEVVSIPMNHIAMELGDPRMVNMVALGAYAAITGTVEVASLAEALREVLPERNHRFIPGNISAIEAGASAVASNRN